MKRATRNDESNEKEKDRKRRWFWHYQVTKQRRPETGLVDASHPEGLCTALLGQDWIQYDEDWNGCLSSVMWTQSGVLLTPYSVSGPFNYYPRLYQECGNARVRRITGVRINMSLDWPVLNERLLGETNYRFDYPHSRNQTNSPTELVLFSIADMPNFDTADPAYASHFTETSQFPTSPGGSTMQVMEIFDPAWSIPYDSPFPEVAAVQQMSYYGQPLLPKLEALGAKVIARRQFVPAQVLSAESVTNYPTLGLPTHVATVTLPPQVSNGTIGAYDPLMFNLNTCLINVTYNCHTATANYNEYFPLDITQVAVDLGAPASDQPGAWSSGLFWAIVHDRRCYIAKGDVLFATQIYLDPTVNLHAKVYYEEDI